MRRHELTDEQWALIEDMFPKNGQGPGRPWNDLYSQDDAEFLLGEGFTKKAAREAICFACRSGDLRNAQWRKRYWFTGRDYIEWIRGWFGAGLPSIPPEEIDDRAKRRQDTPLRLGACPPVAGKEVGR